MFSSVCRLPCATGQEMTRKLGALVATGTLSMKRRRHSCVIDLEARPLLSEDIAGNTSPSPASAAQAALWDHIAQRSCSRHSPLLISSSSLLKKSCMDRSLVHPSFAPSPIPKAAERTGAHIYAFGSCVDSIGRPRNSPECVRRGMVTALVRRL